MTVSGIQVGGFPSPRTVARTTQTRSASLGNRISGFPRKRKGMKDYAWRAIQRRKTPEEMRGETEEETQKEQ
ncbi:hypothetical protein NDU88_007680 [Pleurodeles waltl]|uniref:Uncharacterized protein n=1 Tax=Pleurodeles waltl TaxID=8319 RepID=A0AAV7N712_PLEWA|nr:hypothetical protein NDU88_007680 [Pleurodeles waltl]